MRMSRSTSQPIVPPPGHTVAQDLKSALDQRASRYASVLALRAVPDDGLWEAVALAVSGEKIGGVEALLVQAEACLASVEDASPGSARACLMKCALGRQLQNWAPDHSWTDAQRARHGRLVASTQLPPLSVELIRQLPLRDVETLLGVAVQQAAESPFWHERLTQLLALADTLLSGGWAQGPGYARALLNDVAQALEQLHAGLPDPTERQELFKVERCLRATWLQLVKASLGTAELGAAAQCLGKSREANAQLQAERKECPQGIDWDSQEDMLGILGSELREVGLRFDWTSGALVADSPSGELSLAELARQVVMVDRALLIVQRMALDGLHPCARALKDWMFKHLSSDTARQRLIDACGDAKASARMPQVMFERLAMCGFERQGDLDPTERKLLLSAVQSLDLRLVAAPVGQISVPGEPRVSRMDRLWRMAQRLAAHPNRLKALRHYLTQKQTPLAPGWDALLALSEYIAQHQAGRGERFALGSGFGIDDFLFWAMSSGNIPNAREHRSFFCALWVEDVLSGLPGDGLHAAFLTFNVVGGQVSDAFLMPQRHEELLSSLNPQHTAGLSQVAQLALVRRYVVRALLVLPFLLERLLPTGSDPLSWTDADLQCAMLSLDEVLRRELRWRKDGAPELSERVALNYLEIGGFWASVAKQRPDWLDAQSATYPWLREVVSLANEASLTNTAQGKAIGRCIRDAVARSNTLPLTERV